MVSSEKNVPPGEPFRPGDWVYIDGMSGVGRVMEIDRRRRRGRVLMKDQQWDLPLKKLSPAAPPPEAEAFQAIRVTGSSGISYEIDLHGMRVEEAIEAVDRAIDQAVVNHLTTFKIIHGHGTGALRTAIRQMLARHPHVEAYRFGHPHEGGLACTVADLRQIRR